MRSEPGLAPVLARSEEMRLQVLLGWVVEGSGGRPVLERTGFRVGAEYFYPASAIKLCAAIAALGAIERLPGGVDLDSALTLLPRFDGQVLEDRDESNQPTRTITLGHEIRKLFLVSDNPAFNRLYDLVGPAELNRCMHDAGAPGIRITHRLSELRSAAENLRTRGIRFTREYDGFRKVVCEVPERCASPLPPAPEMPGLIVGSAFRASDGTMLGPKDFSEMNRASLTELQDVLASIVRPDLVPWMNPPGLAAVHREFLLGAMREYPGDSNNPSYSREQYPDRFGKFLLPGLLRIGPRERWRITNKVGQAYGFTIENAFVEDQKSGRSCFVAAVLYCNANGVLNDDAYEYEAIALPFMADLGEAIGRRLGS